ncbi:MAG: hypothetical protein WAV78_17395 [Xanthobacteraceae bacterium]
MCILDRHHRLRGEGLQKIHRVLGKLSGLLSAHDQGADDTVWTKQRDRKKRPIACLHNDLVER